MLPHSSLGLVSLIDVLETLVETILIESALIMEPPDGLVVPIHQTFRTLLPETAPLAARKRHDF